MHQIRTPETAGNLKVAVRQGHGDGHYIRVQIDPGQSLASVRDRERIAFQGKGDEAVESVVFPHDPNGVSLAGIQVFLKKGSIPRRDLKRHGDPVRLIPSTTGVPSRQRRKVDVEPEGIGQRIMDDFGVRIAVLTFQSLLVGLAHGVESVRSQFPPLLPGELSPLKLEQVLLAAEDGRRNFTAVLKSFPGGESGPEPIEPHLDAPAAEFILRTLQLLRGLFDLGLQVRNVHV
ncbi:hypothetical protein ABG088_02575, partial [Hydrogenibacillus schlegelii]